MRIIFVHSSLAYAQERKTSFLRKGLYIIKGKKAMK